MCRFHDELLALPRSVQAPIGIPAPWGPWTSGLHIYSSGPLGQGPPAPGSDSELVVIPQMRRTLVGGRSGDARPTLASLEAPSRIADRPPLYTPFGTGCLVHRTPSMLIAAGSDRDPTVADIWGRSCRATGRHPDSAFAIGPRSDWDLHVIARCDEVSPTIVEIFFAKHLTRV